MLLHRLCTNQFIVVHRCYAPVNVKSTSAGRVYNYHSSTLLAFLHIDVTIRHQITGVEQAANHLDLSLLQL